MKNSDTHKYRRTYYSPPEGYFTITGLTEDTDLNKNNLLQLVYMARKDGILEDYLKVKPPQSGVGAPRRAFRVSELKDWLQEEGISTEFRSNLMAALKERETEGSE